MIAGVVAGLFVFVQRERLRRHAVFAVHPLRQILQLAALAAERLPRRLHRMAPAKHAHTRRHGDILSRLAQGSRISAQGSRLRAKASLPEP